MGGYTQPRVGGSPRTESSAHNSLRGAGWSWRNRPSFLARAFGLRQRNLTESSQLVVHSSQPHAVGQRGRAWLPFVYGRNSFCGRKHHATETKKIGTFPRRFHSVLVLPFMALDLAASNLGACTSRGF